MKDVWRWVQYPRYADQKEEISFLKGLGDLYENEQIHLNCPSSSRPRTVHWEASHILRLYFAEVGPDA